MQKKALEDSIAHWSENLKKAQRGELARKDIESTNCALCILHRGTTEENMSSGDVSRDCYKCVVYNHTERHLCKETPWEDVSKALTVLQDELYNFIESPTEARIDLVAANTNLITSVEKELNFLKSLSD